MTDEEMAAYICPDDLALGRKAVATYTPEKRAVIERLAEVEGEIMLWQAGVGKKRYYVANAPRTVRASRDAGAHVIGCVTGQARRRSHL